MNKIKLNIALVAHDRTKPQLIAWAKTHEKILEKLNIIATGTTGGLLIKSCPKLKISTVRSGPYGGDQQVGALIATGKLDVLIFLEDVLTPQPHDVDVKALLRLAVLYEIPVGCNRDSADLLIQNLHLLKSIKDTYRLREKDFTEYLQRKY